MKLNKKIIRNIIKLYNAITKEATKIFHSHFCLMLCVSFKERKVSQKLKLSGRG